jgi:succinate dehydrogenase / fumarate reductase membrane anchor subunit
MTSRSGGSAQSGLAEWIVQRASALYLAGFVVWLGLRFSLMPVADYSAWKSWFAQGGVRLAFALAFLNVSLHAWVGVRSVLLDYLKPFALRLAAQAAIALLLVVQLYWAAQILLLEAVR